MNRISIKRRAGRLLAGGGLLAAGLLSGCQGAGTQLVGTWGGRGDSTAAPATMPASPAFAQAAAGQGLPAGSQVMMANRPGQPGMMPVGQPIMTQQGFVGPGTLGYPVGYAPAAGMPQQMMMVPQPQPMMMSAPPMMAGPVMSSPTPTLSWGTPTPGATPTVSIVQGPNGPQYVITEVFNSPPVGQPAFTVVPTPTPAQVPIPAPIPLPVQMPVPVVYSTPPGNPTFNPPPPETIALPTPPAMPAPSPAPPAPILAPEVLPPTVSSAKPPTSGAVLPASSVTGPSLGAFPAVPMATPPTAGPKLPAPSKTATDDDFIPPAPVFVPVGR